MKKIILIILNLIILFQLTAADSLEILAPYHRIINNDLYFTGKGYYNLHEKNTNLLEVRIQLINNSKSNISVWLNEIMLEYNGEVRKPILALENSPYNISTENNVTIKPDMKIDRKLVYEIPSNLTPSYLVYNSASIQLSNQFKDENLYFDNELKQVISAVGATYYRKNLKVGSTWIVKYFNLENDSLYVESECSSINPEIKTGLTTWYHENGNVKEEAYFIENIRIGIFYEYFDNGKPKCRILYDEEESLSLQYWNEDGDSLLINGNGIVRDLNKFDNPRISTYENYRAVEGFEIRNLEQDSIYFLLEKYPEPLGGMDYFYGFISRKLKYPKTARMKGTEGKVFVQFIVTKSGELQEVETIKGIGDGCDEEAERVLNLARNWRPSVNLKNEPVKVRAVLPFIFKLK